MKRVAAHISLLVREFLAKNHCSDALATIFAGHGPLRFFPVPKDEENHERTTFCDHRGDKDKIAKRSEGYIKKCVSEMF